MEYPSFLEHMRARFGSNWCVANRASRKTVDYDCVITPKRFALEQDAWARACWEACEAEWDIVRKHSTFGQTSNIPKESVAALGKILEWARGYRYGQKKAA